MATCPVTTGAPPRASSTRRGILGALALAPAAALPIVAAHAATSSAAWDRAMAAYLAVDRAEKHHDKHVWAPLDAKLDRIAPRPEMAFGRTADGKSTQMTYRLFADDLHHWDEYPVPFVREEAARQRDAYLLHQSTADRIGWTAATDESERLGDERCERASDLIKMPAPHLPALLWKLEHLWGEYETQGGADGYSDSYCLEWVSVIMADARRLLGPSAVL